MTTLQVGPDETKKTANERRSDASHDALGLLRQLGEEARNLQRAYAAIHQPSQTTSDSEVGKKLQQEAWAIAKGTFERNRDPIDELLSGVNTVIKENPRLRDWAGLEITRMANKWDAVKARHGGWAAQSDPPSTVQNTITDLDDLIYEVGLATVPSRLEAHLGSYRTGQVLSFESVFEDELPNKDKRQRVLQYLYDHPSIISGIVDVETGTITKISPKAARRAMSWGISFLLAIAVVLGCAALGKWDAPGLRAAVDGGDLAKASLLVIGGMGAHVVVGALKDLRRAAADHRRRFASAGNWVIWGHAKEVYIWGAILFAGVLAYYLAGVNDQTDALTLLAVGYSGDSFVDILLPKFEKGVIDRTEKAKAVIK